MKKLLFLSINLIILFCTNCNQCETSQCTDGNTINRTSSVVKKYFYFKVGSWWVYVNEISLERDSIFVVQDKIERVMGDESCKCEEFLLVQSFSSLYDSLFYNTTSDNTSAISFMRVHFGSSYYDDTYRFEVLSDTSLILENQHNAIITFLPDYKGIQETFKNVYRCFYHKALTDYLSDSYFAPNIGLIRFKYKDGNETYWNLVNYKVIQ